MNETEYLLKEYARAKKNLYKSGRKTFGSADKLAAWLWEN